MNQKNQRPIINKKKMPQNQNKATAVSKRFGGILSRVKSANSHSDGAPGVVIFVTVVACGASSFCCGSEMPTVTTTGAVGSLTWYILVLVIVLDFGAS